MRRFSLACALILCAGSCAFGEVDFNRQIRPILSQSCFACHGLDRPKAIYDWTSPNLPTRVGSRAGRQSFRESPVRASLCFGSPLMEKIGCPQRAMLCRMIKFLFSGNGYRRAPVMPSIGHTKSPSARKFLLLGIRALSVTRSIPLSCKTSRSAGGHRANLRTRPVGCAESQPGLDRIAPDGSGNRCLSQR